MKGCFELVNMEEIALLIDDLNLEMVDYRKLDI